ncbi:MAG: hypothetical protein AVDCRST_MAG18-4821, partial [uncultured Thermomicrobiales bacterium]
VGSGCGGPSPRGGAGGGQYGPAPGDCCQRPGVLLAGDHANPPVARRTRPVGCFSPGSRQPARDRVRHRQHHRRVRDPPPRLGARRAARPGDGAEHAPRRRLRQSLHRHRPRPRLRGRAARRADRDRPAGRPGRRFRHRALHQRESRGRAARRPDARDHAPHRRAGQHRAWRDRTRRLGDRLPTRRHRRPRHPDLRPRRRPRRRPRLPSAPRAGRGPRGL